MWDEDLPIVAKFEVRRRSYLTFDGTALAALPDFAADRELLVSLHRRAAIPASLFIIGHTMKSFSEVASYPSGGQTSVALRNLKARALS